MWLLLTFIKLIFLGALDSPHDFRVDDMCCEQCGGAKETLVQYVRFHHITSQPRRVQYHRRRGRSVTVLSNHAVAPELDSGDKRWTSRDPFTGQQGAGGCYHGLTGLLTHSVCAWVYVCVCVWGEFIRLFCDRGHIWVCVRAGMSVCLIVLVWERLCVNVGFFLWVLCGFFLCKRLLVCAHTDCFRAC